METKETFSIRQMVELTGLSEFTIRGWENRYFAFCPRRGETGRRHYSKTDVERALLLRELLKRDHKIGKIAGLSLQKLQSLFEKSEAESRTAESAQPPAAVSHAIELMALQKWEELESVLRKVRHESAGRQIGEFFLPVLRELSSKVGEGLVSIAQEHIFSAFLKEKIYSSLLELKAKKKSPQRMKNLRFVLAAPEGDHHEIGLLMAHLLIRSFGFTSLYLGPHSPARDLSETALRFNASHVLIVSTVSRKGGARQELLAYASDIQKRVGSHLQILLAGAQAPLVEQVSPSSLRTLRSFHVFEEYLQGLGTE